MILRTFVRMFATVHSFHRVIKPTSLINQPQQIEAILSVLQAVLLGIIQGLSEFLPVSSTAHLTIVGGSLEGLPGTQGPGADPRRSSGSVDSVHRGHPARDTLRPPPVFCGGSLGDDSGVLPGRRHTWRRKRIFRILTGFEDGTLYGARHTPRRHRGVCI